MYIKAHGTLWAIAHLRCPRCHHGKVFNGIFSMNTRCSVCRMIFGREPGYFLGAMYVSYLLAALVMMVVVVMLYLLFPDLPDIAIYVGSCLLLLPFVPLIFRYSRVIWITLDRSIDTRGER
jgi:uncharacterized protein (DUF983 family)